MPVVYLGSTAGLLVLAQLSMSVFLLSHPDPIADFGVSVLTSGQCGFERARQMLATMEPCLCQPDSSH